MYSEKEVNKHCSTRDSRGKASPRSSGVPLFDREFIERVTRGETRLLQLAIIVELGIFASLYALARSSEQYYFFTGNDESRERLI